MLAGLGLGIGIFAAQLTRSAPVTLPDSTNLDPQPAAPLWQPIVHGGQPPADVVSNLSVPTGTVSTGYLNRDAGVSQYDRVADFFVPAPVNDVLGFYALQLPGLGWKIRAATAVSGGHGTRVLAVRFSRDSFQWQVEVTVNPTTRSGRAGSSLALEVTQLADDEG